MEIHRKILGVSTSKENCMSHRRSETQKQQRRREINTEPRSKKSSKTSKKEEKRSCGRSVSPSWGKEEHRIQAISLSTKEVGIPSS